MSQVRGIFQGWLERVHPDDREAFARGLRTFLSSSDREARLEYRLRRFDGRYEPVQEQLVVERASDGEPLRIVSVVEERTPASQPEASTPYAELFHRAHDAFFLVDAEGRLQDFNPAFLTLLGLTAAQARGRRVSHHYRDPETRDVLVDELVRTGSVSNREIHLLAADGSPRVVLASAVARCDDQGRYSGHQAIFHDVTDRSRRDADRRRATADLEKRLGTLESLYAISERLARAHVLDDGVLTDLAALVPGGLRYPDRARVRIEAGEVRATQPGFDDGTARSVVLGPTEEGRALGSLAASYAALPYGGPPEELSAADVRFLREVAARLTETARRIRAEEARHREEAVHRLLVERSTDLLAVLDATGTVRYASPAAERLLGYPEGSLEGERALDLVHPEDRDRIEAAVAEASGDPDHAAVVEHRVRHADGTFRYFESTGRDLLEDPDIRGIVVNARDVTDRTTLEEELRHAQKMEAVGRLAAGVAHQFNNLLTVIRVSARLLEDHFEGSSPPEELVDIDSAAGEAAVLTRRLLAFSGRETLEPRPLDLGEVIRGLESFLRRVAGHAVELEIDLPGQPLPIRADALQIEQVALDLFENALEAMPDGGRLVIQVAPARAGDVPAQIRRPDEWALLRVRDAGPGVPEAIRDEIFEPFFTTKEAGTGLGLATVRSAVSRLGGLVLLSSDSDRGATFTVCLPKFFGSEDDEAGEGGRHESRTRPESSATGPRAERAGAAADPPAEGPGVAGVAEVAPPEEPVAARTVLVVDGDAATRSVVERLLAEDFRVLSAEDGVTALTLLDAFGGTLDLLVTAVEMPQISGEALAARVSTTHPDLEVIYLTEDETAAGKGTPRLTRDTLASRLRPVVGELLPVPEAPV